MKTTTRTRLLLAGLATFWATVALAVTHGLGWLFIGGMVTATLWALGFWPDLDCDMQADLGEHPTLDHRGHVTVVRPIEKGAA